MEFKGKEGLSEENPLRVALCQGRLQKIWQRQAPYLPLLAPCLQQTCISQQWHVGPTPFLPFLSVESSRAILGAESGVWGLVPCFGMGMKSPGDRSTPDFSCLSSGFGMHRCEVMLRWVHPRGCSHPVCLDPMVPHSGPQGKLGAGVLLP